jgi:hypothetical protein
VFDRRRRLAAALFALPLWTATLAYATLSATPAAAGSVTTNTSCTNNAQAGTSSLPITMTGSATPNPATVGDKTVTLAGAQFKIDVPGATLLAGYGLGLLSAGTNSIPASVNLTLLASNTKEGSQTLPPMSVTGVTTITDPTPANKTSGDETAAPLSVTADVPESKWSPTGGDVAIRLGDSSTQAQVGPGGIIKVTFTCTPGTPTPAGCGPAPAAACTGTNPVPAEAFTTVSLGGGSGSTTTTTSSGSTTTTTAPGSTTTTSPPGSTTTTTKPSTTTTTMTTGTTATTAPSVSATSAAALVSGTASYTTTCKNSVTPDVSELLFEVSGATLSPITAGSSAKLQNQTWKVTVPASVLQTGINLGVLKAGDVPGGTASVAVFASNTKEGTVKSAPIPLSVPAITLGADGQALPAVTTFKVPDMSWTSVGGDVAFRMASTAVEVAIGPLKVTFTCEPKAPVGSIVTAAVRGATGDTAASATRVLGTSLTRSSTLARTGSSPLVPLSIAIGLIDLGYLAYSATWPARRRRLAPSAKR